MDTAAASTWVTIAVGALSGLTVSVAAHALLNMPAVRVRAYTDARRGEGATRIEVQTFIVVTNLRGRPVTVEHVMLLRRGRGHLEPREWLEQLPKRLEEGETLRLFLDPEAPLVNDRVVPFAADTATRVWPRRRRPRVWIHAARGPMGFLRGRRVSARRKRRLEKGFDQAEKEKAADE